MLYIISFQSISCSEASPTSSRPHKGPPEGSSIGHQGGSSSRFSERALGGLFPRSSPQSSTRFSTLCSARSSGRSLKTILKPAQGAVFATATLPTSTSGAFPRGKTVIYHPSATATLPTGTPVPSPRAEQSYTLSQTDLNPDLDRSSPRPPYPQVPQSHPGVAKPSSIIPSPRPPCPQVLQCHPHVPSNPTISL